MRRAVIITSYIEYPVDIGSMLRPDDHIVCLDGGYDVALQQSIRPDVLIGDFDSLNADPDTIIAEQTGAANVETISAGQTGAANVDTISAGQTDTAGASSLRILRYPPEKDYTDLELALRYLDPDEFPEILIIGGMGGRLDQTAVNLQLLARYTAVPGEVKTASFDTGAEVEDAAAGRYTITDSGTFADANDQSDISQSRTTVLQGSVSAGRGCFTHIEMVDGHNRCFVIHGSDNSRCRIPSPAAEPSTAAPCAVTTAEFSASAPCDDCSTLAEPTVYLSLLPVTEVCEGVSLSGVKYPLEDATLHRGASLSISNEFTEDAAELSLLSGSLLVVCSRE